MDRLTVSEAAARLGVTPDAVRQRIRRNTIEWEKDGDGKYFVYLSPQDGRRDGVQDALVERLQEENAFLRSELQRKDAILLSLSEGLKALAPAQDSPGEAPRTPSEAQADESSTEEPAEEYTGQPRVPWWRRMFGV